MYLIGAAPPLGAISGLNTYTILYAGQVKRRNLRARFLDHIKKPNPKLKLFFDCYFPYVDFWYLVLDCDSKIDALETLLIEAFNPPCNSIRAPGSQVFLARLGKGRIIRASRGTSVR